MKSNQASAVSRSLSRVGLGILRTEQVSTNQSVAGGIWILEREVSLDQWVQAIDTRLLPSQPHLRSVQKNGCWIPLGAEWSSRAVIHNVRLHESASYEDVEHSVSRLHSRALDYSKPLWSLYLINGWSGKQVVFWRFHHACGDGVSWSAVTVSLLADVMEPIDMAPASLSTLALVLFWLWWGWIFVFLRWTYMALFYPRQAKLVSSGRPLTGQKQVAIDTVCSVERAKEIGHRIGATVNDVMLTAVSRAIARLDGKEDGDGSLAVAIPVNLRLSAADILSLANVFGSISIFLPISAKGSFAETLKYIAAKTKRAKRFPEALVGFGLLILSQMVLPLFLTRKVFDTLASKVKMSFSNVKGTDQQLSILGVPCTLMCGVVPPPNGVGIGIAVVSYGSELIMSVATDEAILKEPRKLMALIVAEFERL